MGVQFCKKTVNPYSHKTPTTGYIHIACGDKFIMYDHKFGDKYAAIDDEKKVFYDNVGNVSSKLVRVNDAYSVTQNNNIITLGS